MDIHFKRWTQLGLGAVIVSGAVAACGTEAPLPSTEETSDMSNSLVDSNQEPAALVGEGESGLGGEGEGGEGEGGVSISAAATDPIVYNSALAITEAHIIAARDAHALGKKRAAAEMFAHPVSEVLFEMAPVFEERGVDDFTQLLSDASAAVFADETSEQINARADTILKTLKAASEKAPDNGTSPAKISAGVAADQIERASDMYRAAAESDLYEPYLDGYGFYKAGEAAFLSSQEAIEAENDEAADEIREALTLLRAAYPTALRPESLNADQAALAVAASKVILAIDN